MCAARRPEHRTHGQARDQAASDEEQEAAEGPADVSCWRPSPTSRRRTPSEYAKWWRERKPDYVPPLPPEPPKSKAKEAHGRDARCRAQGLRHLEGGLGDGDRHGLDRQHAAGHLRHAGQRGITRCDPPRSDASVPLGARALLGTGGSSGLQRGVENGAEMPVEALTRATCGAYTSGLPSCTPAAAATSRSVSKLAYTPPIRARMGWTRRANKVVVVVADAPPHPQMIAVAESHGEAGLRRTGRGPAGTLQTGSATSPRTWDAGMKPSAPS